jgi:hypothetical protein
VGVFVFLINDHPKLKCPHTYYHIPVAVDAAAVLRAMERLASVAVIGTDEGTDDGTNGWKGRPSPDKTKDII